ncbi:pPIWI-associating nuclease domain-containing protein [Urbifossiella limnaea]|uniref:Predicted pPIWI-associating nuclease domain-containing protein n=1 Tax=Urbifossiella limnaea TaxID=2528023 RepID=A0A517XLT1_9BACT|nr:hypothetical protein [Urbifossiella limnaea]QDU18470.1 hypothetical protein ETAA1_03580 [Urbifossiella limnaea]
MVDLNDPLRRAMELEGLHKKMFNPALALEGGILAQLRAQPSLMAMVGSQLALQKAIFPDLKTLLVPLPGVSLSATSTIASMLDSVRVNATVRALLSDETQRMSSAFDAARLSALADWKAIFRGISAVEAGFALPLQAHLSVLFERSALADGAFSRVKEGSLGSRLGLAEHDRAGLTESQGELQAGFRSYFDEVAASDLGVLELPAQLTELPAAELVNQAALVVSTSETEEDAEAVLVERAVADELAAETTDLLTGLVAELDPELVQLLKGAREAFASRHTDYIRHFVTSYRELFTHLLHALAPDDELKKWTKDPKHYDRNKPTRRARVQFLTRDLKDSFGGFLNADVDAVLEFIGVFQKGTHGVNPQFSDEQLRDMKNRTEGLFRFMLVTHRVAVTGRL